MQATSDRPPTDQAAVLPDAGNTRDAFPPPADRPGADVVLYDGECNFCRAQMQRLTRWDTGGRLAYLSIHDPVVAERWPDLSH
ncbi:MAG: DCC1-like thiol-disulfide oxidoreductase family protein, partial [Planctomycetota bacterium]